MTLVLSTRSGTTLPDPGKPATVAALPCRTPRPTTPETTAPSTVSYKNCTAVRAAGADPRHAGDPGYSRTLDRDGVGCE